MLPIKLKLIAIHRTAIILSAMLVLAACGGGGNGGGNSENQVPPTTSTSTSFAYSGPAPSNTDIQRFQQTFYNNLVNDNRCGSCHTRGGAGKTSFVDRTDINFAYSQALTLVDFNNPAASAIVNKVASGHNCWEASTAACRVQMISFIEAWANNGGAVSSSVKLTQPTDRDPNGPSGNGFISFPDAATFGGSQLYADVKTYCSRCHSETSSVQQQPYFASSAVDTAYAAIQSKLDLNDPSLNINSNPSTPPNTAAAKSRLVVRLRDEFHNCWSASCAADANTMEQDIAALAQGSQRTVLSAGAYRSMAQVLNDGILGSSGGHRFELYQIALWKFLEGEGSVVSDTSGVAPALNLSLKVTQFDNTGKATGDYQWVGGGGIQFDGAAAYGSPAASKKLYDLISAAGEYSVEAWTLPANVADEDRSIIAYSDGSDHRNFMLGQTMYNYDYYNRSSATNSLGIAGSKKFSSDPTNTEEKGALQAALQHVVVTYDAVNGRKIYVDGKLVSSPYPGDKGTLASDWDAGYEMVLGDTLSGGASWKGALRMVAVHKRALNLDQITQNFNVPPGEKRFVMFNVSHLANMPASCFDSATSTSYCYIYFEVSLYDSYAYLFSNPHFISLNSDITDLNNLQIKGIHIGINGKLATVGQAYVNVDTKIQTDAAHYTVGTEAGSGQLLVDVTKGALGTIVPKLAGPDSDLMYLEFDLIGLSGATEHPATPVVLPFAYTVNGVAAINVGWRTFDEINATFSQMTTMPVTASTGVNFPPPNSSTPVRVSDVFTAARSQLPAVEDFPAFLSSHQTSVTQLAIAYCAALMHDNTKRNAFFSTSAPSDLKGNSWNNLVNPLVNKFLSGGALYSPSMATQMHTELIELLTHPALDTRKVGLCAGSACSTDAAILNAATITCAAALANAALTMQ